MLKKCRQCGRFTQTEHVRCDDCRAKINVATKTRYSELKAMGLCGRCGKRAPAEGFAVCEDCLSKYRSPVGRIAKSQKIGGKAQMAPKLKNSLHRITTQAGKIGTKDINVDGLKVSPQTVHALSLCARYAYAMRTESGCDHCRHAYGTGKCPFLEVLNNGRLMELALIKLGQRLTELAFGLLKEYIEDTGSIPAEHREDT